MCHLARGAHLPIKAERNKTGRVGKEKTKTNGQRKKNESKRRSRGETERTTPAGRPVRREAAEPTGKPARRRARREAAAPPGRQAERRGRDEKKASAGSRETREIKRKPAGAGKERESKQRAGCHETRETQRKQAGSCKERNTTKDRGKRGEKKRRSAEEPRGEGRGTQEGREARKERIKHEETDHCDADGTVHGAESAAGAGAGDLHRGRGYRRGDAARRRDLSSRHRNGIEQEQYRRLCGQRPGKRCVYAGGGREHQQYTEGHGRGHAGSERLYAADDRQCQRSYGGERRPSNHRRQQA